VAAQLGVDVANIRNWEQNKTSPAVRFLPGILGFLGYDPERCPTSLPEALRMARRAAGLSQEELAKLAGCDETTIAKWERGSNRPFPANVTRLRRIFEAIGQTLPESVELGAYSSELRSQKAQRSWDARRRRTTDGVGLTQLPELKRRAAH
jgi:transcriptional regulator with XRE-family HTH domain